MKYVILLTLSLGFTALSAVAQTYRWVDANGQVHYSSTPSQKEVVKQAVVREESTASLAARLRAAEEKNKLGAEEQKDGDKKVVGKQEEAKQAAYDQAAQQRAQQDEGQLKAACDSMRKDLALYQNYPRARVDIDGAIRRLTPDELTARIADLQKNINTNCQSY